MQPKEFDLDSHKYHCKRNDTENDCDRKTSEFKDNIIKELRKVFTDESNILITGTLNQYDVQYKGVRGNYLERSPSDILCQLKTTALKLLKRIDVGLHPLKEYLPKRGLFENKRFNSCCIVSSAGALKGSGLGQLIGK